LVLRALEATDWNVAAAARSLDVTRAHIYNLIKAHGLSRRRTT
jgi:transcriptional regulator of acetoin/glycerol metabolism